MSPNETIGRIWTYNDWGSDVCDAADDWTACGWRGSHLRRHQLRSAQVARLPDDRREHESTQIHGSIVPFTLSSNDIVEIFEIISTFWWRNKSPMTQRKKNTARDWEPSRTKRRPIQGREPSANPSTWGIELKSSHIYFWESYNSDGRQQDAREELADPEVLGHVASAQVGQIGRHADHEPHHPQHEQVSSQGGVLEDVQNCDVLLGLGWKLALLQFGSGLGGEFHSGNGGDSSSARFSLGEPALLLQPNMRLRKDEYGDG